MNLFRITKQLTGPFVSDCSQLNKLLVRWSSFFCLPLFIQVRCYTRVKCPSCLIQNNGQKKKVELSDATARDHEVVQQKAHQRGNACLQFYSEFRSWALQRCVTLCLHGNCPMVTPILQQPHDFTTAPTVQDFNHLIHCT